MHLVLIGDIHVYRQWPMPWELLGKAILGQLNVWFNRSRRFELGYMPALLERAAGLTPDMLVFSGDLTSVATTQEFRDASQLLAPILDRFPAVMVPGNHDMYTFSSVAFRRMEKAFPQAMPASFPQTRKLTDRWSMLMLNSSVPRTFTSRGFLGEEQLAALSRNIDSLEPDQGLVLLTHYALGKPSPQRPPRWSHRLKEHDAVLEILRRARGRVVYLHGHVHFPWYWQREDLKPARVLDINSGAPCLITHECPYGQGFWSIRLPDDPWGPVIGEHHKLMLNPAGGVGKVTSDWSVSRYDGAGPAGQ
jgi:3',5'-cyclic AMP phosphodiesterase CpdA